MTEQAAVTLTRALGGSWYGSYGMVRCPAHDDREPSLSITERGGRVLVKCHRGCKQDDVIDALRRRGLWPRFSEHRWPCLEAKRPRQMDGVPQEKRRIKLARRIWQRSQPALGTPVEAYLYSRGITIPPPASLRYAPSLIHGPTGQFLPAIVAAIMNWPGCEVVGIHRIFLEADGQDKAQVSQAKLTLGSSAGGAVQLAPVEDFVWLTEGIEDALSLIQMAGVPAWAVLGTSGFKNIVLPVHITTVVLAPDGDRSGQDVIEEAAKRLTGQGRKVEIAQPMAKDWNDALLPFDERAAIVEFDGEQERQVAEMVAGGEAVR